MNADSIINYKTKSEHIRDEGGVGNFDPNVIAHSRHEYHATLTLLFNEVNPGITEDEAAALYLSLRTARHNNWAAFLALNSDESFNDVVVPHFLAEIGHIPSVLCEQLLRGLEPNETLEELRLYRETLIDTHGLPDYRTLYQTPDILCSSGGSIHIGDISVTLTFESAANKKRNKYLPLATWFESKGYRVNHMDFILHENLNNLRQLINQFAQKGLIRKNIIDIDIFENAHESILQAMKLCKEYCDNPKRFMDIIEKNDGLRETDVPKVEFSYPQTLLPEYKPIRSESEIIKMIKNETERLNPSTYFDTNIESSKVAFDDLIDKLKDKPHMAPKSTLKVIDNSHEYEELTHLDLIDSYNTDLSTAHDDDREIRDYLYWLLPTPLQIRAMREIKTLGLSQTKVKRDKSYKERGVLGVNSYENIGRETNTIIDKNKEHLRRGKSDPNVKTTPSNINPDNFNDAYSFIENSIKYYGQVSNKPSFLDDKWLSRTKREEEESKETKEIYQYVKSTNGAQVCHSMSQLYNKIIHTSTYQCSQWVIYTPPNASFICIIPKAHSPFNRNNCDMPMYFLTRSRRHSDERTLSHIECEYRIKTENYFYYISKLCRLNLNKIAGWANAGYQLVASASYMLSRARVLMQDKERLVGLLTFLILDCHQKVSEFLDLLKYISFMPFADIHKLPSLISDKFDILIKTRLDCWMIVHLRSFIEELSKVEKLEAKKPVLHIINHRITKESLGIDIKLPTFINHQLRHLDPTHFIEEINLMNTSRPKHLYGSQFMDKAMTSLCEWNDQYLQEKKDHGGWAVDGHDVKNYPFGSKFCFSSDAIHYANVHANKVMPINSKKCQAKVMKSAMFEYLHYNCSLRGATKEKEDRMNANDLHSTSADECIKLYTKHNFDDAECRAFKIACNALSDPTYTTQYTKSEKEQRGGGRPIATPTIKTKAMLMCVEKPEVERGKMLRNNIIVPGVNKLKAQSDNYKDALLMGASKGYKRAAQLTEDQTKFSENDNFRKFYPYLQTDKNAPPEVRAMQWDVIKKLDGREHLIKRMPVQITEKHGEWINSDNNGVKAIIGWPQGMLNFISTSIHCDADVWITHAYNLAYPNNTVLTKGLVHSDDSTVVVCYDDIEDFKRFTLFRRLAKEMFCLKINDKKLWGSRYLGEVVSNYNLNGNVHMSIAKTIANSFGNLTYQNWPTDVNNQVSTIQQIYRNGANNSEIILVYTILSDQLVKSYQVSGLQLEMLHDIPIDIGGLPDNSAFELAVCGVNCHYRSLSIKYNKPEYKRECAMVTYCVERSRDILMKGTHTVLPITKVSDDWADLMDEDNTMRVLTSADFDNIILPSRGDVFKSVKHLMPRSTKTRKTIENIRSLPFAPTGLEMIITRPNNIKDALGNFVAQTSNAGYELAADHYTQSTRRMAMSQVMQSCGRVVRFENSEPITINTLLEILLENSKNKSKKSVLLKQAFTDDNDLLDLCDKIVNHSDVYRVGIDKRKVLNKMPFVEDKYTTIAPLNDVLLKIIDNDNKTNYYDTYATNKACMETVNRDIKIIKSRFVEYFSFYNTIAACSLIKRQFIKSIKSKLWVQPHLNNETLQSFLEDLYGRTLSYVNNYSVVTHMDSYVTNTETRDMISTLYSTAMLNEIYDRNLIIDKVFSNDNWVSVNEVITSLDDEGLRFNDKLKLGVLDYYYNNDKSRLDKYIDSNNFKLEWITPQKFNPKTRRWEGNFEAKMQYSDNILNIKGIPGNVNIRSSTNSIIKILKTMRLFIDNCFKSIGYGSPFSWGMCDFWRSSIPGPTALIYDSMFSTSIRRPHETRYVNITIDPNLRYDVPSTIMKSQDIIVSQQLRVIETRNGVRLATITPELSLPLRARVDLIPNEMDNMDVKTLYRTNIIVELTLHRDYNIDKSDIEKCFAKSACPITVKPIAQTFTNIMLTKSKRELMETEEEDLYEIITITELVGATGTNVAQQFLTAEVDDIVAEYTDFELKSEFIKHGSLMKHKNIRLSLCKIYSGISAINDINDFLALVTKDITINRWLKEMANDYRSMNNARPITLHKYLSDVIDTFDGINQDEHMALYAFIMSTGLHTSRVWANIDLSKFSGDRYNVKTTSDKPYIFAKEFIKVINDCYFGEEDVVVDPDDELALLLKDAL